jgi:hypothetical protein
MPPSHLSDGGRSTPRTHPEPSVFGEDDLPALQPVREGIDWENALPTARRLRNELVKASTAEECRVLVDVVLAQWGLSASFAEGYESEEGDDEDFKSPLDQDDASDATHAIPGEDLAVVGCLL